MNIQEKLTKIAEDMPKVYEAGVAQGRNDEWSEFWDMYQNFGNYDDKDFSTERMFAFKRWNDTNFYPKYDIKIYAGDNHTAYFLFSCSRISNLTQRLKDCGVILDTSKATNCNEMFAWCPNLTHVPVVSLESAKNILYIFAGSPNLVEIEKLIFPNHTFNQIGYCFNGANALQKMIVEGTIMQSGLDWQWSTKLNKQSIESIINALSTTTSGLTVTLSATAVNNAFTTEEWNTLIATRPNWTVALA